MTFHSPHPLPSFDCPQDEEESRHQKTHECGRAQDLPFVRLPQLKKNAHSIERTNDRPNHNDHDEIHYPQILAGLLRRLEAS